MIDARSPNNAMVAIGTNAVICLAAILGWLLLVAQGLVDESGAPAWPLAVRTPFCTLSAATASLYTVTLFYAALCRAMASPAQRVAWILPATVATFVSTAVAAMALPACGMLPALYDVPASLCLALCFAMLICSRRAALQAGVVIDALDGSSGGGGTVRCTRTGIAVRNVVALLTMCSLATGVAAMAVPSMRGTDCLVVFLLDAVACLPFFFELGRPEASAAHNKYGLCALVDAPAVLLLFAANALHALPCGTADRYAECIRAAGLAALASVLATTFHAVALDQGEEEEERV